MVEDKIYVTKPALPPMEDYINYLKIIWESNHVTNMGDLFQKFQKQLSEMFGETLCLPTVNGHSALEYVLQALELEGEVITTPFTFASTTHAIVRNNLTPVFCDIRREDCTMDVSLIEELITPKTCAIVPVHVYGMPCQVDEIARIAEKHNLKVIYDAAHAFGEKIGDKSIVSYGDAAMISFHATKAFHSIEGGCAIIHDQNVAMRLYQLINFGIIGEDCVVGVGGNAKMNEFQAAMGLCNLKHFDEIVEKRKVIYELYHRRLSQIHGIAMLNPQMNDVKLNYTYCPIFIDEEEFGISRNQVYDNLKNKNIFARKYFYPITSEFSCYQNMGLRGDTPVAKEMSEKVLTLPLYPDLDLSDVERICDIIVSKE